MPSILDGQVMIWSAAEQQFYPGSVGSISGGLTDPGTNGFVVRTGSSGATVARSLTQPAAGLTIANNDGVSANPVFALANDLSALEALSGTGFAKRTGTDAWTLVTNTYLDGSGTVGT